MLLLQVLQYMGDRQGSLRYVAVTAPTPVALDVDSVTITGLQLQARRHISSCRGVTSPSHVSLHPASELKKDSHWTGPAHPARHILITMC